MCRLVLERVLIVISSLSIKRNWRRKFFFTDLFFLRLCVKYTNEEATIDCPLPTSSEHQLSNLTCTVTEKLEKQAESRIRAKKEQPKVNKALAERVRRMEEREEAKEAKKKFRDEEEGQEVKEKSNILLDPRFKDLWENPDFEVDEDSREFGLLNPATANNNVSG
jgi:Rad3-related DNA helicase